MNCHSLKDVLKTFLFAKTEKSLLYQNSVKCAWQAIEPFDVLKQFTSKRFKE